MPSQLHPNQTSKIIRDLRSNALAEADKPEPNSQQVPTLTFDVGHDQRAREVDLDHPKDTPPLRNVFNEHVGNGSGGPV